MKTCFRWICPCFAALIQCAAPLMADPAGPHISVKVTVDSASDYKNIAGSGEKSKVQSRQIIVALSNSDKTEAKDISVKWTIYARSMKDHKLMVAKEGTEKTSLAALQSTVVRCDKVTLKGTPKHTVTSQQRRGGNGGQRQGGNQSTSKSFPAVGEEYYGYAVKVFSGPTLVDEAYSQQSLKEGK